MWIKNKKTGVRRKEIIKSKISFLFVHDEENETLSVFMKRIAHRFYRKKLIMNCISKNDALDLINRIIDFYE